MTDFTGYKTVILARMGEIALKGLNRNKFEAKLIGNLKRRLVQFGKFDVSQSQSRIWIIPETDNVDFEGVLDETVNVFGIVSASIALRFDKTMEMIRQASRFYVENLISDNPKLHTFKVEARRADKKFELNSMQLCEEIGYVILTEFELLKVDVKTPDFVLNVEIRDYAYIYSGRKEGFRGLPVGTAGKGMLLLSGGIDSPVAGFMMASRGMEIEAVYFHSYPYTGDKTKEKVKELAKILTRYTGRVKLHIIDFTSVQLELRDKVPEDMLVIIMRRMMMRISQQLAKQRDALALITGESLGQVASQTAMAIACTDVVTTIPVYRPLIGTDKDTTVSIAKRIGTFDTSILPYEDCCTLFVAKHPRTNPSIELAERCETDINVEEMVNRCLSNIEVENISAF